MKRAVLMGPSWTIPFSSWSLVMVVFVSTVAVSSLSCEAFMLPRTSWHHPFEHQQQQQWRQDFRGPSSSFQLHVGAAASSSKEEELIQQKKMLFELLGMKGAPTLVDSVLVDPITKESIQIESPGVLLGDSPSSTASSSKYKIRSPSNEFEGSSNTFINLLEPIAKGKKDDIETENSESSSSQLVNGLFKQALPFIPPPLRGPLATLTGTTNDNEYIPMRDLFTSPAVSYAYERGWRQGFTQAGFPGPDLEAKMAMDYFAPTIARTNYSVVVDMSCATGLFTRRFAATDKYNRVLGCDYSESMLTEARRRIVLEEQRGGSLSKKNLKTTNLELIRLDVGQIPMKDDSIDCLHAGAAMHCWPDLDTAVKEVYRVLKPGGRYFATTFLATYFSVLSNMDSGSSSASSSMPSQQAFQYFTSIETLRNLLERGGFESGKIQIEVLGNACVVIRAEK